MTLVGKKIAANSGQIGTRAGREEYCGKLPARSNHLRRGRQATLGGTELQAVEEGSEFKLRLDMPVNKFARFTTDSTGKGA